MANTWYEVVEASTRLLQGDLIFDCPLIGWSTDPVQLQEADEPEVLKATSVAIKADVVVMTQACDLEQDKIRTVILCPSSPLDEYQQAWTAEMEKRGQNPTQKAWKSHCDDVVEGFVWNLAILNAQDGERVSTPHRVVDFREVYTVPRSFLESLLAQRNSPRLRLLPPYREHLSQGFARFFMRVGLPVPIKNAW